VDPARIEAFAVAPPGFRDLVARELRDLGFSGVEEEEGGARFRCGWEGVLRANLWCRVASRVLVRVGRFTATDWRALKRGLVRVPWGEWLPRGCGVEVRAAKRASPLYHTGRIARIGYEALEEALGAVRGPGAFRVQIRVVGADVTVSLDTSGEHLHRRGYRSRIGPAPLRENLAAGLVLRAGWRGTEPFLDPMCGSGALAIEAAWIALGVPPGGRRRFAFEGFVRHDPDLWQTLRSGAVARARRELPAPVFASDRDPMALARTAAAARAAGLAELLQVARADVAEVAPPAEGGLVLTNPPYGRRLAGRGGALAALGSALRGSLARWRWAVVVAGPGDEHRLGLRPVDRHPFRHGGLSLYLAVGEAEGLRSAPAQGGEQERGREQGEGRGRRMETPGTSSRARERPRPGRERGVPEPGPPGAVRRGGGHAVPPFPVGP